MAYTKLLLLGVTHRVMDAVDIAEAASDVFALPARSAVLAWQYDFAVDPTALTIALQVSIDGVSFVNLDTSTVVTGNVKTVSTPTAAKFGRFNITGLTLGPGTTITADIIAKVANP